MAKKKNIPLKDIIELHKVIDYTDNPDLSPYRWDRATTIESIGQEPILSKEASRVESSDSKCEDT